MTQSHFAREVGLSHTMIGKLIKGEPGKIETYRKILGYFDEDLRELRETPNRKYGVALLDAYFMDTLDALQLPTEEEGLWRVTSKIRTISEDTIGNLFCNFSREVLLALEVIGSATNTEHGFNLLMTMAESLNNGKRPPKGFFAQFIRKPKERVRLTGSLSAWSAKLDL